MLCMYKWYILQCNKVIWCPMYSILLGLIPMYALNIANLLPWATSNYTITRILYSMKSVYFVSKAT